MKKWYITGGRRATQSDCDVEPIVCYGYDRLDAVANSGITVWSEEEARKANVETFRASCVQALSEGKE